MSRSFRILRYSLHNSSGQARVFVPRPGGGYDEKYLGTYGSPESKAEYARVIAGLTGTEPPDAAGYLLYSVGENGHDDEPKGDDLTVRIPTAI